MHGYRSLDDDALIKLGLGFPPGGLAEPLAKGRISRKSLCIDQCGRIPGRHHQTVDAVDHHLAASENIRYCRRCRGV